MAFCVNCGTKLPDGAKFCPSCGTASCGTQAAAPPVESAPAAGPAPKTVSAPPPSPAKPAPAAKPGEPEHDDAYWIEEICNGGSLEKVPEASRTAAVCYAAVKKYWYYLRYVPEHLLTEDMCLAAIMEGDTFSGLSYVPERLRTYPVCLAAMQYGTRSAYKNIDYVPQALYDERLFVEYAKCGYDQVYDWDTHDDAQDLYVGIEKVPEQFRTKDFWLARISSWGTDVCRFAPHLLNEFPLIPREMLTKELCFVAVKKLGMLLEFVPEEYKTYEMCLTAVGTYEIGAQCISIADNPELAALRFVPEQFKTRSLCMAAVSVNGTNLAFVPESMKDEKMCRVAFETTKYRRCGAFKSIPDRYKTEVMCMIAVDGDMDSKDINLKYVPEALRTEAVCRRAVHTNFYEAEDRECLLQYIPPRFRTRDVCLSALWRNTEAWKYVPPEVIDKDFCVNALEKEMAYYDFIPEEYRRIRKIMDMRRAEGV